MRLRREKADTFCLFHGEKMIDLKIQKKILSFREIPELAAKSQKTVLMLRHSIRESLVNGNYDPRLTAEGRQYAVDCGKLLTGLKDAGFGASPRRRTIETAQALIEGGNFQTPQNIRLCPEIYDHSMFESPQALEEAIDNGTIPMLFRQYFATGKAEGMKDAKLFVADLLNFLTQTRFNTKNTILFILLIYNILNSFFKSASVGHFHNTKV